MRRLAVLTVAVALLAAAPPALAAQQGARLILAPVPAPASRDPDVALAKEATQYTGPYQTLLSDAAALLGEFRGGVTRFLTAGSPDPAGADAWIAQMRPRLAVLRAKRATLGPPPAALIKRLKAADLPSLVILVNDYGPNMGGAVDAALEVCDQVLALAPAAARGDAAARAKLAQLVQQSARTALQTENTMIEANLRQIDTDHPQGALLRSVLASNRALISLMELGRMIHEEPQADRTALVRQTREDLVRARTEALSSGPLAQRSIRKFKSADVDGPLKALMFAALGTYEASGKVETQIADTIEGLLNTGDPAEAERLNNQLQDLMRQRLKLQFDRQSLMAG